MPELFNTGFEYPWSNVYFATALFESRIVKLVGVKTPSLLFIFLQQHFVMNQDYKDNYFYLYPVKQKFYRLNP